MLRISIKGVTLISKATEVSKVYEQNLLYDSSCRTTQCQEDTGASTVACLAVFVYR